MKILPVRRGRAGDATDRASWPRQLKMSLSRSLSMEVLRGALLRRCDKQVAKKNKTLKKISVNQLQLGMYVTELCGSWMDHPFWNTRFKLENPADLTAITKSAVSEVWIDTARGLDVALTDSTEEAPEIAAEDAVEHAEQALREAVEAPVQVPDRVELAGELSRAAEVCEQAREAVTAMFGEARMGRAIDTEALAPLVEEISDSVIRNPGALISLARLKRRDDYTYMHSVAVCGLMIALARQLGLEENLVREVGLAGLVHDIGKAACDLEILNKPGKLTDAEFAHMKLHPVAGHAMLVEGGSVGEVPLDVCLHHHEKVDGKGYPGRLDGDAMSIFAKMGAVCDVYDAITSARPYKDGWDPALAIRKMNEWSSGHFDTRIYHAFVKTVGIYPVGSLVRLESGLLAVVCDSQSQSLLTPVVKTFYCTRRKARLACKIIDLSDPGHSEKIAAWVNAEDWKFADLNELWAGAQAPTLPSDKVLAAG